MEQLNKLATVLLIVVGAGFAFLSGHGNSAPTHNDTWFENAVLKNPQAVVVKFGAEWCPPCRSMDQALIELESRYARRARFLRIDIDKKPELFAAYRRSGGIPQIMVFRDGKVVAHERGFSGREQLNTWLSENL